MIRRLLIALGAVLALVCAPLSAQAITWGHPDGTAHPEVVIILAIQDDGPELCSGTLLSPDLVLTAAHCAQSTTGHPNIFTYVSNSPAPAPVPAEGGGGDWVTGTAIAHPQFDNFADLSHTYDVGVVQLHTPIDTGGVYGTLPALGFLDRQLATSPGKLSDRKVSVVGYGEQGTIPSKSADYGQRWSGTAAITGLKNPQFLGDQSVRLSNNPGQGTGPGGICFGDSGGPAFWIDPATGRETTSVVGVTSYLVTGQCAGNSYSFRTDTAVAQDFVRQYLN